MTIRFNYGFHFVIINFRRSIRTLRSVYGVDCLTERTYQNWFKKFRSEDFSLKDDQRSGRPSEVNDDKMKAIFESNRHITGREIAKKVKCITHNN
ncbi:hypothetical protein ACFW04_008632 [Cataglyphis niger]